MSFFVKNSVFILYFIDLRYIHDDKSKLLQKGCVYF